MNSCHDRDRNAIQDADDLLHNFVSLLSGIYGAVESVVDTLLLGTRARRNTANVVSSTIAMISVPFEVPVLDYLAVRIVVDGPFEVSSETLRSLGRRMSINVPSIDKRDRMLDLQPSIKVGEVFVGCHVDVVKHFVASTGDWKRIEC